MKTLHTGLRASDLDRSVDFYRRFGFLELARDEPGDGRTIVMLYLPGEERVTLELIGDPRTPYVFGNSFSHFVVQVEDIESTVRELAAKGIEVGEVIALDGDVGPWISFVHDPDGFAIELVQWPAGHGDGITVGDLAG